MAESDHLETHQSKIWRGEFGDEYVERNIPDTENKRARLNMWAQILKRIEGDLPKSVVEIGANVGGNLHAIKTLIEAQAYAVEPNDAAREKLIESGVVAVENVRDNLAMSIDFSDEIAELAFTCVVLIHIHPDDLLQACKEIYRLSSKYVLCIEYFNDKPITIPYREQENALFKRDFGGFWMDNFPDLKLVDYGFLWKRTTTIDNMTWWIFRK